LREASLPNGRPIFRDNFATATGADGQHQQIIERKVFVHVDHGRAAPLREPVIQRFAVTEYQNETIFPFLPVYESDGFYLQFYAPLPTSFVVADCSDCLPAGVAFKGGAPQSYSNPVDLLTDMQTADDVADDDQGVTDNLPPSEASIDPSAPTADYANPATASDELAGEVTQLQDKLDAAAATNSDLQNQLAGRDAEIATLQNNAEKNALPTVPAHVRKNIKPMIQKSLDADKAHKPLSLADAIESSKRDGFPFHAVSALMLTMDGTDSQCVLHAGDYIVVDELPAQNDAAVRMKVDVSHSKTKNRCEAGTVVRIKRVDLQDMLNDFEQKLQRNEERVSAQIAETSRKSGPAGG
jgi:hypothetical protein